MRSSHDDRLDGSTHWFGAPLMAELVAAAWVAEDRNGREAAHLLLTPTSTGHEEGLLPLAAGWGLASGGGDDPMPFATVTAYVNPLMVTIEGVRLPVRRQWTSLARNRGQVILIVGDRPRAADEDAVGYLATVTHFSIGLVSVASTG